MMARHILPTGQTTCADVDGTIIPCAGTGQDAEFAPPPDSARFEVLEDTVRDAFTGLTWLRDANAPGFPLAFEEALDHVRRMNDDAIAGHDDWRLPDRRELFSLVSFGTHSPALDPGHPFENVFNGWYWTATPSAMHPKQVWHVQMSGGRMFWGSRTGYELVWPVRGASDVLPALTAGESPHGVAWPDPRFEADGETVLDTLTGLRWMRNADLTSGPVTWSGAFERIERLNREQTAGTDAWRLPDIREFESLTDAAQHSPALPAGHPFRDTREAYWSSTNSGFEADWAMCHYLHKGAVGVGFKRDSGFHVWAVTG